MSTGIQEIQRLRIMNRYKSACNLENILSEINSMKFWKDGSGALMAIRPSDKPGFLFEMPTIQAALSEIAAFRKSHIEYVMVNRLPAGCLVPKHTDNLVHFAHRERWHLPILTNPQSYWWDCEIQDKISLQAGFWHGPVHYWMLHSVENQGSAERIHLVVDLMRSCEE